MSTVLKGKISVIKMSAVKKSFFCRFDELERKEDGAKPDQEQALINLFTIFVFVD